MNTIVCDGDSDMHLWDIALRYAIRGIYTIESKGEGSVSDTVNSFIKEIFAGYAIFHELNVCFTNIKSCSVLTTTEYSSSGDKTQHTVQTRRDDIYYMDDVPFFIEEIKEYEKDESKVKIQLEENTGLMSPQFYGNVPFVVACSVAGSWATLYGYFRKGRNQPVNTAG